MLRLLQKFVKNINLHNKMSTCSAAEIAEKRRIALEKLQAKKERLGIAGGGRQLQQGATARPSPANSSHTVHDNSKNFSGSFKQPTKVTPSAGASTFLNDLKRSNVGTYRCEARSATHPYQRTTAPPGSCNNLETSKPLAPVFVQSITCKVYMVSPSRFAVQPSNYHSKLVDLFKSIPSKAYDTHTRIWDFALNDYELFQTRVSALKPEVVIGVIPANVLNLCRMPPKVLDRSCLASIEPTLADKLLPFQQEGVCFAISQHGRVMICDEMGLGKTYQALAVADFYRDSWPLLICTTASVRDSWSTHIRQLLPNVPLQSVQVLTSNQQYVGDAKVLITSYHMLERHVDRLLQCKFGVLIFDESHTLKNAKAKCTSMAERLSRQARYVVLLSGTPALSRPLELYTQLQMLDQKFMTFRSYTSRYCDARQSRFGWDANGQSNLQELNVVLKLKFMIRRTKAEVLPELAEKFRETVVLDPALVWSNEETKESLKTFANNLSASKGREREEILLKFYARTAEVKCRAVCAYLRTLVKDGVKFIVFAHHRIMMDAITESLMKSRVNFVRIDGSTKNELRAEYINTFQNSAKCQVAVLSLKACNSGVTLTAAEIIIFAELDWNPSTLAQAESRAHRIGQQKPVICRYLMASKTADDAIWNMLKSKQDVLNRAGLFCDDLQDATHTTAPTGLNKIEKYFSPTKSDDAENLQTAKENNHRIADTKLQRCNNTTNSNKIEKYFSPTKPDTSESLQTAKENNHCIADTKPPLCNDTTNMNLSKELENIEEFFQDDDDVFKNLLY